MKITLTLNNGDVRSAKRPYENADHAVASGACPGCKAEPFKVAGCGKSIDPDRRHDTYRADAVCIACSGHVGILRVKVDTLFGIEEDERVASMGIRIY